MTAWKPPERIHLVPIFDFWKVYYRASLTPPAYSTHLPYIPESVALERERKLREALEEAEEVISLSEHPEPVDPQFGAEVEALGERIGYGALMHSASASWRESLARQGYPVGGEHVAGPCRSTVEGMLIRIRAALGSQEPKPEEES